MPSKLDIKHGNGHNQRKNYQNLSLSKPKNQTQEQATKQKEPRHQRKPAYDIKPANAQNHQLASNNTYPYKPSYKPIPLPKASMKPSTNNFNNCRQSTVKRSEKAVEHNMVCYVSPV